jgi:hypothetical protein
MIHACGHAEIGGRISACKGHVLQVKVAIYV